MAIEDTITQLITEARAAGLSQGDLLAMCNAAKEADDLAAIKAEIAALPVPSLSGPENLELQAYFAERKDNCPVRPELAVGEIAAAFKAGDVDSFWRGVYLLLTMMRAQLQHLDREFENV